MTAHRRRAILEDVAGVTAYDEDDATSARKQVEGSMETIDLSKPIKGSNSKAWARNASKLRFKHLKDELEYNRAAQSDVDILPLHETEALKARRIQSTITHFLKARQRETTTCPRRRTC